MTSRPPSNPQGGLHRTRTVILRPVQERNGDCLDTSIVTEAIKAGAVTEDVIVLPNQLEGYRSRYQNREPNVTNLEARLWRKQPAS